MWQGWDYLPWLCGPIQRRQWWGWRGSGRNAHMTPSHCVRHLGLCICTQQVCSTAWLSCLENQIRSDGCQLRMPLTRHPVCTNNILEFHNIMLKDHLLWNVYLLWNRYNSTVGLRKFGNCAHYINYIPKDATERSSLLQLSFFCLVKAQNTSLLPRIGA